MAQRLYAAGYIDERCYATPLLLAKPMPIIEQSTYNLIGSTLQEKFRLVNKRGELLWETSYKDFLDEYFSRTSTPFRLEFVGGVINYWFKDYYINALNSLGINDDNAIDLNLITQSFAHKPKDVDMRLFFEQPFDNLKKFPAKIKEWVKRGRWEEVAERIRLLKTLPDFEHTTAVYKRLRHCRPGKANIQKIETNFLNALDWDIAKYSHRLLKTYGRKLLSLLSHKSGRDVPTLEKNSFRILSDRYPTGKQNCLIFGLLTEDAQHQKRTLDLTLVDSLQRDSLFISDALGCNVSWDGELFVSLFSRKQVSAHKTEPVEIWQSIVDKLLKVIHVQDVESVNHMGWPRLMGLRNLGHHLLDDIENNLQTKFLAHFKDNVSHMADSLITYGKDHSDGQLKTLKDIVETGVQSLKKFDEGALADALKKKINLFIPVLTKTLKKTKAPDVEKTNLLRDLEKMALSDPVKAQGIIKARPELPILPLAIILIALCERAVLADLDVHFIYTFLQKFLQQYPAFYLNPTTFKKLALALYDKSNSLEALSVLEWIEKCKDLQKQTVCEVWESVAAHAVQQNDFDLTLFFWQEGFRRHILSQEPFFYTSLLQRTKQDEELQNLLVKSGAPCIATLVEAVMRSAMQQMAQNGTKKYINKILAQLNLLTSYPKVYSSLVVEAVELNLKIPQHAYIILQQVQLSDTTSLERVLDTHIKVLWERKDVNNIKFLIELPILQRMVNLSNRTVEELTLHITNNIAEFRVNQQFLIIELLYKNLSKILQFQTYRTTPFLTLFKVALDPSSPYSSQFLEQCQSESLFNRIKDEDARAVLSFTEDLLVSGIKLVELPQNTLQIIYNTIVEGAISLSLLTKILPRVVECHHLQPTISAGIALATKAEVVRALKVAARYLNNEEKLLCWKSAHARFTGVEQTELLKETVEYVAGMKNVNWPEIVAIYLSSQDLLADLFSKGSIDSFDAWKLFLESAHERDNALSQKIFFLCVKKLHPKPTWLTESEFQTLWQLAFDILRGIKDDKIMLSALDRALEQFNGEIAPPIINQILATLTVKKELVTAETKTKASKLLTLDPQVLWDYAYQVDREKMALITRDNFLKLTKERKVDAAGIKSFLSSLMASRIDELEALLQEEPIFSALGVAERGIFWQACLKNRLKLKDAHSSSELFASLEYLRNHLHRIPLPLERVEAEVLSIAFANCLQFLKASQDWQPFQTAYDSLNALIAVRFSSLEPLKLERSSRGFPFNVSIFVAENIPENQRKRFCKLALLFSNEALKIDFPAEIKAVIQKAVHFTLSRTLQIGLFNPDFYNEVLDRLIYFITPSEEARFFNHLHVCRLLVSNWHTAGGIKETSQAFCHYALYLHSESLPLSIKRIDSQSTLAYFQKVIDQNNPLLLWISAYTLTSYRSVIDNSDFIKIFNSLAQAMAKTPLYTPQVNLDGLLYKISPNSYLNNLNQDCLTLLDFVCQKNSDLKELENTLSAIVPKTIAAQGSSHADLWQAFFLIRAFEKYTDPTQRLKFLYHLCNKAKDFKEPCAFKKFPQLERYKAKWTSDQDPLTEVTINPFERKFYIPTEAARLVELYADYIDELSPKTFNPELEKGFINSCTIIVETLLEKPTYLNQYKAFFILKNSRVSFTTVHERKFFELLDRIWELAKDNSACIDLTPWPNIIALRQRSIEMGRQQVFKIYPKQFANSDSLCLKEDFRNFYKMYLDLSEGEQKPVSEHLALDRKIMGKN